MEHDGLDGTEESAHAADELDHRVQAVHPEKGNQQQHSRNQMSIPYGTVSHV